MILCSHEQLLVANNRQLHYDEEQLIKQKAAGNAAEEDRLSKAACYAVKCWAQYPEGSQLYNANYVSENDAQSLGPELAWVQSMQSQGDFVYSGFDKATDNIAAFTGVTHDAIGGNPVDSLTKPITDGQYCVTAECAAGLTPDRPLSQAEINEKRNAAADFAGGVSTQTGRFGAAATAAAQIPSPYSPALTSAAITATVVSWVAGGVEQLVRPNPEQYIGDSLVDAGNFFLSDRFPMLSPAFNETAETIKNSNWMTDQGKKK